MIAMKKKHNVVTLYLISAFILSLCSSLTAQEYTSIFYISKSDNGNQVHYGIRLAPDCSPQGSNPVYPYWKLENKKTENLLEMEQPAFGIASQSVSGNQVILEINGLKNNGINRLITVKTFRAPNNTCQARAFIKINQTPNPLSRIHVTLASIVRVPGIDIALGGKVKSLTLIDTQQNQETIPCLSNCEFGIQFEEYRTYALYNFTMMYMNENPSFQTFGD